MSTAPNTTANAPNEHSSKIHNSHHRANLLRGEDLFGVLELDLNVRLGILGHDIVRNKFLVVLHGLVLVLAADKALDVKDRVLGVDRGLVLGGVSDKALEVVTPLRRRFVW